MEEILLEIKHMNKKFGSIVALKDVDLTIRRGQIHGLIGENGSGKSTITSIAAGMQQATSGEIFYKGKPWKPTSMVEAQRHGISMILQEANTIEGCTVAENLFAGQEDQFSTLGFFNTKKLNKAADDLLKKFGLDFIKGKDIITKYGFEERKLIEIVRAVTDETEILVVDETSTALSFDGRKILYKLMDQMVAKNKAVIFISHDLDEIMEHCTILTVLRDGEIRGEISKEEMNQPGSIRKIRELMVGRDIGDQFYRSDYDVSHGKDVVLEYRNVSSNNIKDFSLKLHKGEIIGIGGLSGCGMHEIGRMAFGLEHIDKGSVVCGEKAVETPTQAVHLGIGYISKNRDQEALILNGSINVNIELPSLSSLQKHSFVSPKKARDLVNEEISLMEIKCESGNQWVNTLSGGNKQKVSFAKWIAKKSDIIIMDCPTRGVDIGVKQSMYRLITDMKREGKAILMISEEMAELIGMADQLLIMKDFKVTKTFMRSPDLKETDIIEYMI